MDITKFIDGVTVWFSKEIAPIVARISALEARQPEKGEPGQKGEAGKDFDPSALAGMFVTAEKTLTDKVDTFLKTIPVPENGKDGKDADPELMKAFISGVIMEEVAEQISQIPVPKDGIDGKSVEIEQVKAFVDEVFAQITPPKDGKDGVSVDVEQVKQLVAEEVSKIPASKDGKDGQSVDKVEIKEFIQQEVSKIEFPEMISADEVFSIGKAAASELFKSIELPVNGKDGVDGNAGEKGLDGINGKDGENGRDALDIEILPAIDEEKSYPRGTYAQHKKGLWKSFQRTDGMRGWECIVAGVAEVKIEKIDNRNFIHKTVLSTGESTEECFSILNTIYKGVYKDGGAYETGDLITWGGNIWHCNENNSLKPKEGIAEWTLAVKRGRDYMDPAKLPPKRNPDDPVKIS